MKHLSQTQTKKYILMFFIKKSNFAIKKLILQP